MKDIQGIQRGKCNSCECEEYRAPAAPGQLRCEYCNHTPGEHVRMVELGACTKCGKDNCDKYVSEDPNSYTDCQYCGCGANHHEGAAACKLNSAQPLRCWHMHLHSHNLAQPDSRVRESLATRGLPIAYIGFLSPSAQAPATALSGRRRGRGPYNLSVPTVSESPQHPAKSVPINRKATADLCIWRV